MNQFGKPMTPQLHELFTKGKVTIHFGGKPGDKAKPQPARAVRHAAVAVMATIMRTIRKPPRPPCAYLGRVASRLKVSCGYWADAHQCLCHARPAKSSRDGDVMISPKALPAADCPKMAGTVYQTCHNCPHWRERGLLPLSQS